MADQRDVSGRRAPSGRKPQLTRDAWEEAALKALLTGGPEAVAVQPLAARLGATKGSFYWHFRTRDELLRGALERWRERFTLQVIDELERLTPSHDPAARLRLLLEKVTSGVREPPGEQRILAGIHDPVVRDVVTDVTARRTAYVAELVAGTGLPPATAGRRAFHFYAWFLGYAQLAATQPRTIPDELDGLLDDVVDRLLADPARPPGGPARRS